jgi:hypothetical protein
MRKLLAVIFLLASLDSLAQADSLPVSVYKKKHVDIPLYKDGDTSVMYRYEQGKAKQLGLPDLITSRDTFHFRFWANGQAVEIWSQDYKTFNGRVTNFTESYEEFDMKKQKQPPSTMFFNQTVLDSSASRKVFELTNAVISIPQQDSIEGWYNGFDGETYVFETSTSSFYSFKDYWTPSAYVDKLPEAKQVQSFADTLRVLLNLEEEYDNFFATLKPGSYTNDHFMIMTKVSERRAKKWKKYEPHWDYMETIRDTLNHYLSDTLTKIFLANNVSIESRQYFLSISRHNRLKKIRTNDEFLFFSDRLEYLRDKRKIRKAFRKVRIEFVNAKRAYGIELDYQDQKVQIF